MVLVLVMNVVMVVLNMVDLQLRYTSNTSRLLLMILIQQQRSGIFTIVIK